ncbi:transcription initiation factor TFIID subunit 8-like [Curcuma longa]|uniref:transcription initiation factor TFIID subunit 8-like n=1 Tax=Curcuma longa TaxID=136217 RepID=UPI003D9ED118
MSDGEEASGRNQLTCWKRWRPSEGGDFGHSVAKVAVSKICETHGFHGTQRSANYAFSNVAVRYICKLGETANFYANLAGRTCCNVFDVLRGLQDLGSSRGYPGASDSQICILSSGIIEEIIQFVNSEVNAPFQPPIVKFPISRIPKCTPSFAQVGEVPVGNHIPDWLPRFPDPNTYSRVEVCNKRITDTKDDHVDQESKRRKAERSLLSLQKQLGFNVSARFQLTNDGDLRKGKSKRVAGNNPFLAPPFLFNEKEIIEIAIPQEVDAVKRSVEIETSKVGSLDFNDSEKSILPGNRPAIRFKIGVDKRSIPTLLSTNMLDAKRNSLFMMDDEKDDKKKREENILKEVTDKPHYLTQNGSQ